ncbi:AAA family ATPase [Mumia xiangluensis]|uniref:AAA family ATPase n=1 Tax=Mumia xiangluensis TaxID=1678900 RepID=A0ABW1QMQ3_9ACTN
MRLVRVTLRNFRGVEEATVTFAEGVTVVVGPNETGKSSIAEAIRLLRTTKSSARSQAVRNVQPVGRDVGPEAEIELQTGPYDLVYRKRWLSRPIAELDVRAPVPQQLSGDDAHQRFDAILAETVDVDLWNALEVIQGQALDQPSLAHISALQQALDDSAGATGDHDALMAAVDTEYEHYFTPGGKPRGDYATAAATIAELQARAAALRARSAEMDRYVDEHHTNEQEFSRLSALEVETQARLERSEKAVRALDSLRSELTRTEDAVHTAETGHLQAVRDLSARQSLADDLRGRSEAVEKAHVRLEAATTAHDAAGRAAEEARSAAATAADRATEARRAKDDAAERVARHRDLAERDALAHRVRRARDAGTAQARAHAECASIPVDDAVLASLTELATTLRVAEGARDAAATRLSIRALGPQQVRVGDEVLSEQPYVAAVLGETRVVVEGVIDVVVSPGTPPADLDRRVDDAREAFEAALRTSGTESLESARVAHERRRAAAARRDAAQTTLADALDGATLDELEVRLASLEVRLASLEVRLASLEQRLSAREHQPEASPAVAGDPGPEAAVAAAAAGDPGPEAAATADPRPGAVPSREDLDLTYAVAREDAAEADAAAERARTAHEVARDTLATAAETVVRAQQALDGAAHELEGATARLGAARDERSDDSLEEAVAVASASREASQTARQAARAAWEAASPETLAMELDNARALVVRVDAELDTAAARRVELATLLEDRATEGIHDALIEVEAALERAQTTYARTHRSAQAVHLLRATLRSHRDEAQRQYVAPFKERIDRMGQVVFGADFQVTVGTDLAIESRTLGGRTVPFGSLSGGAREQLGVLGRLACAQLVAADKGAPVILDDTMGFADPDRLEQLAVVLNDVGRTAQVVLLTCQPTRFASVGNARTARLVAS